MSEVPARLTTRHLNYAVLPDDGVDGPVDADRYYAVGIVRLDTLLELGELWAGRFDRLPEPEVRLTLQELVQAARRRVRAERLRLDTEELQARRFVLERVREEIAR